ncbi:helix-turn-helix transcriptional regulator [Labrys neptuniae]
MNLSPFLCTKEASEYLSVSRKTLEKLRANGKGPLFIKFGKKVLYRECDLLEFANERAYRSTSQYH